MAKTRLLNVLKPSYYRQKAKLRASQGLGVDKPKEIGKLITGLQVSVAGFFLLLAIATAIRLIGNRLVPAIMPLGWPKVIALGWVGGFAGSLVDKILWQFGPQVAGINLVAAIAGSSLFILLWGLAPFIKILLGKT